MFRRCHLSLLSFAAVAVAGCNTGPADRTTLQIATKGGGNFLVVDAKANYAAACGPGEVDISTLEDYVGLRALGNAQSTGPEHTDEILWKDMAGIDFGAASGNLGDFCEGMPVSLAATIHYKDGSQQKRDLRDTTDDGIGGKSERGDIVIPLREIAKFTLVKDQHWPWSYDPADVNYITTLRVVDRDGHTVAFPQFHVGNYYDKQKGDEYLQTPYSADDAAGLPVTIAGARVGLPWRTLKSADFLPYEAGKDTKAKVTFADGHTEELVIRRASIETPMIEGVEQHSISLDEIAHLEAQTHSEPIPKPPGS